ncbi:hypothetical protein ACKWTF_006331 [Chironomus riparius]
MLKSKRIASKKVGVSDKKGLEKAKNEVQTKVTTRTLRSTKKRAAATDDNDKHPQDENCANEQNKKKYVPKLPVKVYGDNSSFFDSIYHAFKKENEDKVKQKRKTQRDRVKAVKNVEVSTPKNRLKRKCDLNFDISPISLRNATIDLASFECDDEPVSKTPKLTHKNKSPEIAEQEPLEVDKAPESKVAKSESHENSSIEMAGDSVNISEKEDILQPEISNRIKTLKAVEQKNETPNKDPQSAMISLASPKLSMNEKNGSKSIEKSLTVPELHNSSLIDPESSIPPSKVSKIDDNKNQSSLVVPDIEESITNLPEKDKSKHKVVQFIDAPEENKASELEISKINETINLRPGKWRRSLAAWRKSHNPNRVINRASRKFVALFPIRTDPGVLERYKKKLHESLEKSALLEQSDEGRLQAELSLFDSSIECASINKSYVLQRTASQRETIVFKKSSIFYGLASPIIDVDVLSGLSAQQICLRRCGQIEPLLFDDIYSESQLPNCEKIGEGVYGEVFMYQPPDDDPIVLKIIPIEGDLFVNGGPQKRFSEILSEIVIAEELSGLSNGKENKTDGFVKIKRVKCVRGAYPQHLLDAWEIYNDSSLKGSENDNPDIFDDDQLYIVFEQYNAGLDLEAFVFKNAEEAFSVFVQVALTLAVAENKFEFEHRDLHWGNILIARTNQKYLKYHVDGKVYEIPSYGVKATIIDFTLSRMVYDGAVIYDNLAKDQELFESSGDYQFDIYRLMRYRLENDFKRYDPYTNLLWLHYLTDKLIDGARYKFSKSDKHKSALNKIMQLRDSLLEENQSASDFVKSLKH